ncbi:MAG: SDR family oxidoreductase [Leptospira sp.]|nr:SDR family oxidoreductase [Leptospira sp.]
MTNECLHNRVAIVTGASKGIGLGIAKEFAEQGANLVLCARNKTGLKNILNDFGPKQSRVETIDVDLSQKNSAKSIVDFTLGKFGKIDIIVNNVGGITQTGQFEDLNDSDWIDSLELNLLSSVRLIREAIPLLRKSDYGRVINISSFVAKEPGKFNPHYSASKAGLLNLSKYLSNYLANDHITVNTISPGNIETEGWEDYIENKSSSENIDINIIRDQEQKRVIASIPLGRQGKVVEIARMVSFLASDNGSYITGANIVIDGGKLRSL